jgi:hypothetical protein
MVEKLAGLDWNALLQKAEEVVSKFEEEVNLAKSKKEEDYFTNDAPMTGIEEMRGSEHAYYEGELAEAEKILQECYDMLQPSTLPPKGEA